MLNFVLNLSVDDSVYSVKNECKSFKLLALVFPLF